jgi:hypothetical protein
VNESPPPGRIGYVPPACQRRAVAMDDFPSSPNLMERAPENPGVVTAGSPAFPPSPLQASIGRPSKLD